MKVHWTDDIGAVDVRAAADAERSRIWAGLVTEFGPTERHHAWWLAIDRIGRCDDHDRNRRANIAKAVATWTAFAIIPTTN